METIVVGVIAAFALVVGAVIQAPRLIRDPVNSIAKQVEIYNALPDTSPAKAAMLERIEQQVNQLDSESSARRNPSGIVLGLMLLVAAGASTWLVYVAGGWWWLTAPLLLLLWLMGIVGFFQGVEKTPRAANGQALSYQKRQADKAAAKAAAAAAK